MGGGKWYAGKNEAESGVVSLSWFSTNYTPVSLSFSRPPNPAKGGMQAYDQDYYLSLSSQFPLLTLDEAGVCSFLSHLGYPHYSQNLSEHNITGEVLIHLDHQALKDVGIHSVGQRLNILKTVYILKLLENIPIEEGNYVPPSEELEDGQIPSSQVIKLLTERDDRIRNLESEVHNLHLAFQHFKEETLTIARTTSHSLRSPTFHPLSNASTLSRSNSLSYGGPRPRQVPNPNLSITSPPSTSTSVLPDSPNSPIVTEQQQQQQPPTPSTNHLTVNDQSQSTGSGGQVESASSSFSIDGIKTPTTPTYAPQTQVPPPTSTTSLTTTNSTTTNTATSRSRERETTPSASASASAGGSGGDNPYRSFRVTLEDPCYKVLPAALKKYKINDDWRLYALFICYGNTERCLAYDEKPLLLFQRLKESNDNPVFMLRHIKDIKSPISVAAAKHAARRDKRLPGVGGGVERSLMGTNRDGTTTNASGLVGNARPTRLHHPPVLLPVGGGQQQQQQHKTEEEETSTTSTKEKNNQGYCIAIYPYLAEREDEFDVSVGDTFIILSKTKGWWVVHRDGSNLSDPSQPSKSAWVPAGCLLETSVPPLSLSSSDNPPRGGGGGEISNAASIPILPSYVVSVSTPGIALMDYSPSKINNTTGGGGGIGELEVKKGQSLRILKRYNHWSYAIKEDGNRGWVPSWFCGRANKDNSTGGGGGQQQQQPITPTSSTIPGTGDNNRPVTAPTTVNTTNKPPISIAVPSSTSSSLPNNGVSNGGAKSAGPVLGTTSSVSSGGNGGNGTETDGKE